MLLGNLWLARRLSPPPVEGGRGSLRGFVDRLNEAAAQAGEPRRGRPGSPFGDGRGAFGRPPAVVFETGDLPDLSPLAGVALVALAVLIALGVGASVGGAWQTVLLWVNRVPFSPDVATAVTDPIFGKDISFFLFELPFLRLVQGLFNGLVVAALIISLAQYLVAASRGGLVFSTQVRVHLGVLAGLFLLSVAFGYQLDKFDLVYSTRGIATGVSFTDQNAQFLAYDALTVISGIAAALLVGGAFTRMLWPLGLTIAVWFLASIVIGRLYPEAIQRFTVEPNQYAQEERYIGNNIAMTRLAFDLNGWKDQPFKGDEVLTRRRTSPTRRTPSRARACGIRGRCGRRSTSSRPCASTTTSPTSTRTATRSTAPSARSCCRPASWPSSRTRTRPAGSTSGSSTPTGSGPRWSRSTRSAARASRT